MKQLLQILGFGCLCLAGNATADRDQPSNWRKQYRPDSNGPWIGVSLDWLEPATAAQLKDVPAGFGLLVEKVEPNSPAADASLQPLDVLWKIEDQLISNRWQFYSLTRMFGVGKTVDLTVVRKGESLQLPVTIGRRPAVEKGDAESLITSEILRPPLPNSPIRSVDYSTRSGFIKDGDLSVRLNQQRDGFAYEIRDGEKTLAGGVLQNSEEAAWPKTLGEEHRRKLRVLFESLADAEDRTSVPRVPRVRRVPVKPQE